MLFDSWYSILTILFVGTLTYVSLIVILRLTGKRTLSKLNAFDFIITVALGSTVATIIVSNQITFAEGVTAILLLTIFQFIITWLSKRIPWIRQVVTGKATLVLYQGKFLHNNMKSVRIAESEILQAIREQGIGNIASVDAVVLETNGVLTVITELGVEEHSVLRNVEK